MNRMKATTAIRIAIVNTPASNPRTIHIINEKEEMKERGKKEAAGECDFIY
jgi:5-deoxy-D-glucuronate isomerase